MQSCSRSRIRLRQRQQIPQAVSGQSQGVTLPGKNGDDFLAAEEMVSTQEARGRSGLFGSSLNVQLTPHSTSLTDKLQLLGQLVVQEQSNPLNSQGYTRQLGHGSPSLQTALILQLQRTQGNRAVQHLIQQKSTNSLIVGENPLHPPALAAPDFQGATIHDGNALQRSDSTARIAKTRVSAL